MHRNSVVYCGMGMDALERREGNDLQYHPSTPTASGSGLDFAPHGARRRFWLLYVSRPSPTEAKGWTVRLPIPIQCCNHYSYSRSRALCLHNIPIFALQLLPLRPCSHYILPSTSTFGTERASRTSPAHASIQPSIHPASYFPSSFPGPFASVSQSVRPHAPAPASF